MLINVTKEEYKKAYEAIKRAGIEYENVSFETTSLVPANLLVLDTLVGGKLALRRTTWGHNQVDYDLIPGTQNYVLEAVGLDGLMTKLGNMKLPTWWTTEDQRYELMRAFWVPKLNTAGCRPLFYGEDE